ncbi:hypothetical protein M409DRAFT_29464 [Zasmidium cellare ATCC 36951]|uniref:Uncharacterized protein n=1 Tax=Zasmidium cellare ATCC 36951 TaxID=1080233 RepID=A0A6A6C352_ZASCE|nr:uncharacterized protein M409DRAFT_29464 [Zasmidium cellare ATCC 36951]KAF2160169.1 hypothetical protein M409DRAFT_29464 [Zasmidium cellare ATCC 36951]
MPQRLIVGIDYGTSNSGAAYALFDDSSGDSNTEIEVINDWPHGGSSHYASDKVPSDIAYGADKKPAGFGFDIPHNAQTLQWVKLLLEPDDLRNKSAANASRVWRSYEYLDERHLNKTPVDAVADYLRWLWHIIKAKIERDEADAEIFDTALLTVVLTVPATWSERAKYCMQRAARAAGIPEQSIKLISEPEAAAIFSLKKQAKKGQITKGDCVVVCDAGGGTVDVVAYQVHSQDPLSLDQVTVSKGDFCGSAFIDAEFQNQVKQILGADWNTLDDEIRARIEDEFEYKIKRTYNPSLPKKHSISVNGLEDDEDRDILNGKMKIDDAVLSQAFESVMTPIGTLIDGQIAALKEKGLEDNLKGILLVGGFSGSEYLHTRMREEFPGKNDIKIWRPDKTWTSVVQGAVACEASGSGSVAVVHSRLSGYNYGVPYATDSGKKVKWLVRKGQPVQSNMATEPYGLRIDDQDWLDEDSHCHLLVPLVRSEEDDASDDYGHLVTPHAEIDCRVPTHLRHSKEATLIQERPRKAWHIPATLVLFLDGAVISFKCRIQDEEVGVTNVTYFRESPAEQDLRRTSTLSIPRPSHRADSVISEASSASSRSNSSAGTSMRPALSPSQSSSSSSPRRGFFKPRAGTWLGVPTTIQTKREKKAKEKDKLKKASTSSEKFNKESFVPPEGLPTYERKPSGDRKKQELQPWMVEFPGVF